MCGIAGFVQCDVVEHQGLLHRMTSLLANRGPDLSGHFLFWG